MTEKKEKMSASNPGMTLKEEREWDAALRTAHNHGWL